MLKAIKLLLSMFALIFLLGMVFVSPTLSTAISFIVLSLLTLAVIALLSVHDEDNKNTTSLDKYSDISSEHHADTLSF